MTKPKLSEVQADVLAVMMVHGGRLVREPGGFWTVAGVARSGRDGEWPAWSVTVQTVRAMEKKGLIGREGIFSEWQDPRVLTKAGIDAYEGGDAVAF